MEMKQAAAHTTTKSHSVSPSKKRAPGKAQVSDPKQTFAFAALNMSWQLAVVVLVPILLGVQLDKALGTSYLGVTFGILLALAGSGLVVWRALQAANRMPVPKLTEAQKRAIRKAYEEEDDD
jgi:F0F1-type ATP synthase assembly protein I